jgi:hypothetical protein
MSGLHLFTYLKNWLGSQCFNNMRSWWKVSKHGWAHSWLAFLTQHTKTYSLICQVPQLWHDCIEMYFLNIFLFVLLTQCLLLSKYPSYTRYYQKVPGLGKKRKINNRFQLCLRSHGLFGDCLRGWVLDFFQHFISFCWCLVAPNVCHLQLTLDQPWNVNLIKKCCLA